MENFPLFIDVLIMLSVVGSASAGVMCGWQLCADNAAKAGVADREDSDGDGASLMTGEGIAGEVGAPMGSSQTAPTASWAGTLDEPAVAAISPPRLSRGSQDGPSPATPALEISVPPISTSEFIGIAERLMRMADRITADVDAHDAQLNEVNHSLSDVESGLTMEAVVAAVEKLVSANQTMQQQLSESRDRIVEQAREIEKAEAHAHTDALTQIGNRRAFDREVALWTGQTPGVLALIDIDHFKKFNDEHGHRAGDEVLRSVAERLRSQLAEHCLVARYGGEEFGLVFRYHKLEDVLDLIETARRSISQHTTTFEGNTFHVTCSLGVTRMLAGEPSTEWLQRADDGLYLSKEAGRDCAHCIDALKPKIRQPAYKLMLADERAAGALAATEKQSSVAPALEPSEGLTAAKPGRHDPIDEILKRIPDRDALMGLHADLLTRLTQSSVKLSLIAITVTRPEPASDPSSLNDAAACLGKLVEVCQSFCRAVDRLGYLDRTTLLLCMPGIEGTQAQNRVSQLKAVVGAEVNLGPAALRITMGGAVVGDTFDKIIERAVAGQA